MSGFDNMPRWAGDPNGRHELRYWDGTQWTDQVSDAGVIASDPVTATAASEGVAGDGEPSWDASAVRAARVDHSESETSIGVVSVAKRVPLWAKITVPVIVVLGIAAIALGSSSQEKQEAAVNSRETTATTKSMVPATARAALPPIAPTTPTVPPTRAVPPTLAPAPAPAVAAPTDPGAIIFQYLKDNFGIPGATTSWFPYIRGVRVSLGTAWVETSLNAADPSARSIAYGICNGVSGYVYSNSNRTGAAAVRVGAADGFRLVLRQSISDPC